MCRNSSGRMNLCSAMEHTNLMQRGSTPSSTHRRSHSSMMTRLMSGDRIGGSGSDTSSNAKRILAPVDPFAATKARIFSRSGGWPTGSSSALSTIARIALGELGAFLRTPG